MRPPKPGDIVAYNAPDKFGRVAESADLTLAKVESTARKNDRPIVFLDNGSWTYIDEILAIYPTH